MIKRNLYIGGTTVLVVLAAGLVLSAHSHPQLPTRPVVAIPKTSPAPVYKPYVPPTLTSADIPALAAAINKDRADAGLPALAEDPSLEASAQAKCSNELANNYHAHIAPDGTPWQSFIRVYYPYYNRIGENLAWSFTTVQQTNTAWLNSPLHRENIMQPSYIRVGYAICGDSTHYNYVVQHFEG